MSFGIPVRNGLGLGLLASTSLATGNTGYTPPPPPAVTNGILQEASASDFIMMEDDTSFILQEA
jgi:hypothetical protein